MIARVTRRTNGEHGMSYYYEGDLVVLDDARAQRMIDLGYAEPLVVTLDSVDGSVYDTVLYSKDMAGITDIAFTDIDLTLVPGDALTVAYTNTDARTVGVRLMLT